MAAPLRVKLEAAVVGPSITVRSSPAAPPALAVPVRKVQLKLLTLDKLVKGLLMPLIVMLKAVVVGTKASTVIPKFKFPPPPTATVVLAVMLVVAVTAGLEKVNGGLSVMLGKIT